MLMVFIYSIYLHSKGVNYAELPGLLAIFAVTFAYMSDWSLIRPQQLRAAAAFGFAAFITGIAAAVSLFVISI